MAKRRHVVYQCSNCGARFIHQEAPPHRRRKRPEEVEGPCVNCDGGTITFSQYMSDREVATLLAGRSVEEVF